MSATELLALLKKYMQFIVSQEGTTFVTLASRNDSFTDEELIILEKLQGEVE